jgi:hypothetical protein
MYACQKVDALLMVPDLPLQSAGHVCKPDLRLEAIRETAGIRCCGQQHFAKFRVGPILRERR